MEYSTLCVYKARAVNYTNAFIWNQILIFFSKDTGVHIYMLNTYVFMDAFTNTCKVNFFWWTRELHPEIDKVTEYLFRQLKPYYASNPKAL